MQIARPRRSVLYVPASNARALAKAATLSCDALILDLEDAVAPADKQAAREGLRETFPALKAAGRETIIRINPLSGEWGTEDMALASALEPDGVLLPKVDTPRDVLEAGDLLDDGDLPDTVRLWAMIETPRAVLNIGAIAELGRDPAARLSCLVAGTNDLAAETGIAVTPDRRHLSPWLMQIVLAARAGGLDALDGVCNDFKDIDRLARECEDGAAMGFDGKTLIHPDQIAAANTAFSPSVEMIAEARAVVAAFAQLGHAGQAVISLDGRMLERLHLARAERVLAKAGVNS